MASSGNVIDEISDRPSVASAGLAKISWRYRGKSVCPQLLRLVQRIIDFGDRHAWSRYRQFLGTTRRKSVGRVPLPPLQCSS